MENNPLVDEFINKSPSWKAEFEKLRAILLDCSLSESVKWGKPCYLFEGKNVVLLHGFKEYCALLFFKGALLRDFDGLLVQQTENVQAGRQIRFANAQEITEKASAIRAYVLEAIEFEKAGLKVEFDKTTAYDTSPELLNQFDRTPGLKVAFEALTPGRQRAYLLYFSEPKQSKTRELRIEKYKQQIFDGKGLHD